MPSTSSKLPAASTKPHQSKGSNIGTCVKSVSSYVSHDHCLLAERLTLGSNSKHSKYDDSTGNNESSLRSYQKPLFRTREPQLSQEPGLVKRRHHPGEQSPTWLSTSFTTTPIALLSLANSACAQPETRLQFFLAKTHAPPTHLSQYRKG